MKASEEVKKALWKNVPVEAALHLRLKRRALDTGVTLRQLASQILDSGLAEKG